MVARRPVPTPRRGPRVTPSRRGASLRTAMSLGVECVADAVIDATNEAQILTALDRARRDGVPLTVLGGGTNVVPLARLPGRVLRVALRGVSFERSAAGGARVTAAAGETWHALVRRCLGHGVGGLENLALIPGAVGAAPIQNIGAYGRELASVVHRVHAIDRCAMAPVSLPPDACDFRYRDSAFKRAGRHIVTGVTLHLGTVEPEVRHPDVALELRRLSVGTTPAAVAEAVIRVRRRKLPDPRRIGNVGSFFKNPTLTAAELDRLRGRVEIPAFQAGGGHRVPAARLIEACGWKGHRAGDVGVWPRHALVLVNYGGGSGRQVLDLARRIADSVAQRFDVALDIEPTVLGED